MKITTALSIRKRYSSDRSMYALLPSHIAFVHNEEDVVNLTSFARNKKLSITARGGGTGLSGAAVSKGIIIDFSKYMNTCPSIGKITAVKPGMLLKDLRPLLEQKGFMLPSVPLHGDCAIGGNINTCSVGPRTVKYGTLRSQVQSLRGVLADGRILDTAKELPIDIKAKLHALQKKIRNDSPLIKYLHSRPPIAGGYHLRSFLRTTPMKNIATDLIVGSVGTLVLLTEVRLKLPRLKSLKNLYLLYFADLNSLQKALNTILTLTPASVEYADSLTLSLWGKKFKSENAIAALIVGFEHAQQIDQIIPFTLKTTAIPVKERTTLWKARQKALPLLERKAKHIRMQVPSGIDDLTIHPKDFSKIIKDVQTYAHGRGVTIASFGHIGVGSIHLRAFVDLKHHPQQFESIANAVFMIARKYNGTLIGEHNAGRARSRYLSMESARMYSYMKEVKKIFDPENILNPNIMFDLEPMMKHVKT